MGEVIHISTAANKRKRTKKKRATTTTFCAVNRAGMNIQDTKNTEKGMEEAMATGAATDSGLKYPQF